MTVKKRKAAATTTSTDAAPAAPKQQQQQQQTDFPRGGIAKTTASKHITFDAEEEMQEPQPQPKLFFEGADAPAKKRRVETDEPKPKKSKKDKTTEQQPSKQDADATATEEVRKPAKTGQTPVQLSLKRLATGMLLLGAVKEIRDTELVIALPNNIFGFVPITEISDQFTQRVEAYAAQEDDSDDDDKSDDDDDDDALPSLESLFTVGQLVRCIVSNYSSDAAFAKQKSRVELSLRPSRVNANIAVRDLVPNMTLQAAVRSQEDHGYVLDLGINNASAFVSTKDAAVYVKDVNGGQDLEPGQIVQCAVLTQPKKDDRVVNVTINPSPVKTCKIAQANKLTFQHLMPGTLVSGVVAELLPHGLVLKFLSHFSGTVHYLHLAGPTFGKLRAHYKVNDTVDARLLWVDPENRMATLCMSTHVVQDFSGASSPAAVRIGMMAEATVKHVLVDTGVLVQFAVDGQEQPVTGFLPITKITDSEDMRGALAAFEVDSKRTVRVVSFDVMSGMPVLSCQPSVLKQQVMSMDAVTPGQVLTGTVFKLEPFGVLVKVSDKFHGLCHTLHLADGVLQHPEKKFPVGKTAKFRVLAVDPKTNRLSLTAKPTLMDTVLPLLAQYSDAERGMLTHGVVQDIRDSGLVVAFWNNVRGFVHKKDAAVSEDDDLATHFKRGQPVKCFVKKVLPEAEKLLLSLDLMAHRQQSTAAAATTSTLLAAGSLVRATVLSKDSDRVLFSAADGVMISVDWQHLSDSLPLSRRLLATMKADKHSFDILVLRKDDRLGQYVGTLKRTLIAAAQAAQLPSSLQELVAGTVVPGYVSHIAEHAVFINFAGTARGRCALKDLSVAFVRLASDIVELGQTVLAYVMDVDLGRERVALSLKTSEVLNAPLPAHLMNGTAERAIIEQQQWLRKPDWLHKVSVGMTVNCTPKRITADAVDVECDVKNSRVPGHVLPHHFDGQSFQKANAFKAVVLDIDFVNQRIDVSRKAALMQMKPRAKVAAAGLQDAVVELVKEDYAVVSIAAQQSFAYVCTRQLNTKAAVALKPDQRIRVALLSPTEQQPLMALIDHSSLRDASDKSNTAKNGAAETSLRVREGEVVMATVSKVAERGLEVTLPGKKKGFVRLLELCTSTDSIVSLQAYRKGQQFKVRVLTFRNSAFDCSARAVQSPMPTVDNVQTGQALIVQVTKVTPVHLFVRVSDKLFGRIHAVDFDDHFVDKPFSTTSVGSLVRCVVLSVHADLGSVDLSARRSMVDSSSSTEVRDAMITASSQVKAGELYRGYVTRSDDRAGAFVALGRDVVGRVRIANVTDAFVQDWKSLVPPGQLVTVRALSVHPDTGAIDLSMKQTDVDPQAATLQYSDISVGDMLSGNISKITNYGAFVKINGSNIVGLCHISKVSDERVEDINTLYMVGDKVKVIVLSVDALQKRISLGMKPSLLGEAGAAPAGSQEDHGKSDGSSDDEDEDDEAVDAMDVDNDDEEQEDDDNEEEEDEDTAMDLGAEEDGEEEEDAEPLQVAGFDWWSSTMSDDEEQAKSDQDSDDDDDEDDESDQDGDDAAQKKRVSRRKKKRAQATKEAEIVQRENQLLDPSYTPELAEDFERLLVGSPNSSYLWIKYMAFQLKQANIVKAREVAERAIKTIHYREEQEKLNIWVAWMNLENQFGTKDSLVKVFERATQYNDPKTVHMHLVNIYIRSEKFEATEELLEAMIKRFKESCKVWCAYGQFLLERGRTEDARSLLQRSLKSLAKRKRTFGFPLFLAYLSDREARKPYTDIKAISKFAQLEYKHGETERGRTLFENIVANYPKRVDLWNVYLDMEIKSHDLDAARRLFDRIITFNMSSKKMKFFFKKYLEFEKKHGDDDRVAYVKQKAVEYVATLTQE
ncbi:rRNA biogenesis protein rrp5 [Sorochytrium milnesiophthora]